MHFCISTAVWKRPQVFALFAKGIHNLIQAFPQVKFDVIVAGSEGETSQKMVTEQGFHYIEVPNDPLGHKFNSTMHFARTLNPDYVLCLGSDDIISPELFGVYLKKIHDHGVDYMGVTDFYFYDVDLGKAVYWGGYVGERAGSFCGAGTVLGNRILNEWNWTPWVSGHNKGLDRGLHKLTKRTPHRKISLSLKEEGVFAVDLKSSVNITPLDVWPNSEVIDKQIILEQFKYLPMGNNISEFAFVDPSVIMGDNNVVMEGAIIRAGVIMGNNNYVGAYSIIGDPPEKHGYWDKPSGVTIGSNNIFSKQVTIDAGAEGKQTVIGNSVTVLKNAHVGHNAIIHDNVTLSCNVAIGGWTEVGEGTVFGIGSVAHQRLVIPEGCMFGMNAVVTKKSELSPHRKYAGVPVKDIGSNVR